MKKLIILLSFIFCSYSYGVTYEKQSAVMDQNHFTYSATLANDTAVEMKIDGSTGYSLQLKLAEATPAAFTIASGSGFISAVNDTFFDEAHGLVTGASIAITTSDTLPTGLSGTGFYVSKIDDDFFYIMATRALAITGTPALDLTDDGTGTHTFTPEGPYAGTVTIQYSVNGTDWNDIVAYSSSIGTKLVEDTAFFSNWLRFTVQATRGQLYIEADVNHK